jgi:alpha-tubulin suppressor-like RCC1 family protein
MVGCGEDATSPSHPEPGPALATASAAAALAFVQVNGGGFHTCGVATDGRAFCWGGNNFGQLGDGTTIHRLLSVPVAGPM